MNNLSGEHYAAFKKMPPKRYNYIDRVLNILDRSITVDILKNDQHLLFLFKKTERLVAALYLVTNLLSDMEALKWEIRKSGTNLSAYILSFIGHLETKSGESHADAHREITRLFSLLNIAHAAGLLSPMNASLIKGELQMIFTIVDERKRYSGYPLGASAELKEGFFGVPKHIFTGGKNMGERTSFPSEHTKAKKDSVTAFRTFEEFRRFESNQKDIKDIYKGHTPQHPSVLYKRTNTQPTFIQGKPLSRPLLDKIKDERKQSIINLLQQRNNATVKDFLTSITGCSEKTIQRLLIELVHEGVLKREGARRWSRYSMSERQAIVQ